MSTKIYTGLALPGLNTKAALARLGSAREVIQGLVDKKNKALLVERIVQYVDSYVLARHMLDTLPAGLAERTNRMPWFACLDTLVKEQEKCRGGRTREPLIDCDVELSLFMLPKSGRVLGMVQEERIGALEHLRSMPGVVEFDYWNNTDRPEELTAREWGQRARTWNQVFRDATVTRFTMRWQPELVLASALKDAFPSLQERARQCAVNAVQNAQLEERWPPAERESFLGAMRVLRQVEVALADPASTLSQEVAKQAARFTPLLTPDLGEHLFTQLGDLPGLPPLRLAAGAEVPQN
jgi:hypothetical protein